MKHALLLPTLALGACSTTTTPPVDVTSFIGSTNPGAGMVVGNTIESSEALGTTLGAATGPFVSAGSSGRLTVYQVAGEDTIYIHGISTNEDSGAFLVATNGGPTAFEGAAYDRYNAGTLPTSGSANYTGAYLGAVADSASIDLNNNADTLVSGDIALNANFATGTINGEITNRVVVLFGDVDDVTLSAGTIAADGSYAGTASGGYAPSVWGDFDSAGTFEGVIGGDGASTAGAVRIFHDLEGFPGGVAELGVFIAEE